MTSPSPRRNRPRLSTPRRSSPRRSSLRRSTPRRSSTRRSTPRSNSNSNSPRPGTIKVTKPGFNKNKLKAAQKQLKANIKGRKNLENIKNIIGKQKLAKKYIVSTWKPRTGQITINDRLETINEGGNNRNRNNSYGRFK